MTAIGSFATRYKDMATAVLVVFVVVMLVVPLPPALLDLLIAANITFGLFLLIQTMYVRKPLELASFPSILLLTTLFRLAINVSVTRQILLHGDAGSMVHAFGNFVVGGNIVVGVVIFAILVVIQFVVITNGAGRVAEVAARFTLDAMPGKQMAIDADLNAGQITEDEARERRLEISREADFYGSMDGASKFVKGDAIAGIIIIAINIVGGIAIGVLMQGMPITEALQHFTILTIGDGLAAQVPALLISTATGVLVTRAASEGNLGGDITGQLAGQPRATLIAGGVVFAFGLVPGLPMLPFFALGGILLYSGRRMVKRAAQPVKPEPAAPAARDDDPAAALAIDPIELVIGFGLIELVDPNTGGTLLDRLAAVRRQIASELGIVIPKIRIHDDLELSSHEYLVRVRGAEVARGDTISGHLLAIDTGDVLGPVSGIPTTEPAFGMPATWVPADQREHAEALGHTVVDAESMIVTHLTEAIRRNIGSLLTREEARKMLDDLKAENAAAVEEVVPDRLTVGEVQRVLQALLSEGVPIKDLSSILEAIGDRASQTRDPATLAEYARAALGRSIVQRHIDDARTLRAINLSPDIEDEITRNIVENADGSFLALDPPRVNEIAKAISGQVQQASRAGMHPVLLATPRNRRHVRQLLERTASTMPTLQALAVISLGELHPTDEVDVIATVN